MFPFFSPSPAFPMSGSIVLISYQFISLASSTHVQDRNSLRACVHPLGVHTQTPVICADVPDVIQVSSELVGMWSSRPLSSDLCPGADPSPRSPASFNGRQHLKSTTWSRVLRAAAPSKTSVQADTNHTHTHMQSLIHITTHILPPPYTGTHTLFHYHTHKEKHYSVL